MSKYKDFQGKSLDDAIREACEYYGVEREKLEIEILNDAKMGIFGLVGVKKASIRAARVQLGESVTSLLDEGNAAEPAHGAAKREGNIEEPAREASDSGRHGNTHKGRNERTERTERNGGRQNTARGQREPGNTAAGEDSYAPQKQARVQHGRPIPNGRKEAVSTGVEDASPQDISGAEGPRSGNRRGNQQDNRPEGRRDPRNGNRSPRTDSRGGRSQNSRNDRSADKNGAGWGKDQPDTEGRSHSGNQPLDSGYSQDIAGDSLREDMPEFRLEGCDEAHLFATVAEVVQRLVGPIVGEVPCAVEICGSRVRASVDCGEASGLLVGREGQTLASVQYLAARIIAKQLGGSLRLQIDAGNYRERQDDKLKELALALAEKARTTHRSQSTRPLSAYQRRIVHLALEGDTSVQTHSKGEGAQRRVIIQVKRNGQKSPDGEAAETVTPADAGNYADNGATSPDTRHNALNTTGTAHSAERGLVHGDMYTGSPEGMAASSYGSGVAEDV